MLYLNEYLFCSWVIEQAARIEKLLEKILDGIIDEYICECGQSSELIKCLNLELL